ncbi:hypothetical protein [Paraglaciecola polaris]|uniref:TonB-dependent receptor n=1 Tax=Paraglaciecola polaris LMG 21857 TaxID=1129793 RepID=K6YPA1_9ALTE|nr:hypothetical protein [Paraglaciecola polaris]GAC34554.1 hypothetical protein GPLA_3669 [Paraglaciecola polaris LMG 21857]
MTLIIKKLPLAITSILMTQPMMAFAQEALTESSNLDALEIIEVTSRKKPNR